MYQRRMIPSRPRLSLRSPARCRKQDYGLNMGQLRMKISKESTSVFSAIQHLGTSEFFRGGVVGLLLGCLGDSEIFAETGITRRTVLTRLV